MDTVLIDLRDELAYRKLRGEKLSKVEAEILAFVNEYLEKHLPCAPGLPEEIKEVMDRVNSLLWSMAKP